VSFAPEKAIKSRVLMLSGDEDELRRRALQEILTAAGVTKDDFDLENRAGDDSSPQDWYASASTSPFLSERRTVIVRHLLRRNPDDIKGLQLKDLPETSLLILVADEEAGRDDDRSRKSATYRTKWEKLVKDAGGHVEVFKADPKAARDAVKKDIGRLGKTMSDRSIETLIEMTGGNLSRALGELEKLAIYVGASEQIREADVKEIVMPAREWNVFRLIDSIFSGAIPDALSQLRTMIGGQMKAEEAAISRILPLMSRQLRLVWQARICLNAKCPIDRPTAEARAMFPAKPNILDEKPYRQSALAQIARSVSLSQLSECLRLVAETDARLKGGLAGFSGIETMERLVLDMDRLLRG
jgi:DNA polymerase-3 subunit delta